LIMGNGEVLRQIDELLSEEGNITQRAVNKVLLAGQREILGVVTLNTKRIDELERDRKERSAGFTFTWFKDRILPSLIVAITIWGLLTFIPANWP
jgi:hypothetical protein